MCVGKMFSDLAKGFDYISHEVLVDKLHLCGIRRGVSISLGGREGEANSQGWMLTSDLYVSDLSFYMPGWCV
jgi:hypothetical protein